LELEAIAELRVRGFIGFDQSEFYVTCVNHISDSFGIGKRKDKDVLVNRSNGHHRGLDSPATIATFENRHVRHMWSP